MEKGSTSGVQDSLNGLNFGKKIYFEDVDSGVQAKTSGGPLPCDISNKCGLTLYLNAISPICLIFAHSLSGKKQAKGERIIKVDAQNFGFNGSAKASSCLGIQHSFNEIAAWFFGGRSTTVPM
ncbi:hypothetical protein Fot_43364 [Forsythia ovata]|uniref:Uncharacterized protein n=1 Tax=Forsythia ovata TaxID=205694 RepID=A0ABD1RQL0_9LAMI